MDVAQLQVQIAANANRRLFATYCAELHLPCHADRQRAACCQERSRSTLSIMAHAPQPPLNAKAFERRAGNRKAPAGPPEPVGALVERMTADGVVLQL